MGFLQGSALDPVLFNIFLITWMKEQIPDYVCRQHKTEGIVSTLENRSRIPKVFDKWRPDRKMKSNRVVMCYTWGKKPKCTNIEGQITG